jgi:RNA polymerase sigma factor (TIGR02999 family)
MNQPRQGVGLAGAESGSGDPPSASELLVVVYDELRRLAACKVARELPGQTLDPTALVHDAWLRLRRQPHCQFANRTHFFSAAAEAMRRILIERARYKKARRHGGGMERVDLLESRIMAPQPDEELLAVDEALNRLAEHDPEKAELVKLRYFIGLTVEETAEVMGISEPTVKRHWAYARAWLFRELKRE